MSLIMNEKIEIDSHDACDPCIGAAIVLADLEPASPTAVPSLKTSQRLANSPIDQKKLSQKIPSAGCQIALFMVKRQLRQPRNLAFWLVAFFYERSSERAAILLDRLDNISLIYL